MEKFGDRLKHLRGLAKLTQEELAAKSDIPAAVVSFYETGERTPGLTNIRALCSGLRCSASELLGF